MKKYILGAIVILLAIVGSAFIKNNHNTKDNLYYWYQVDASGNIVTGSQAFMGVQEDVSYATTHLPCTPGKDADCIRGFTNPITTFPTNATGNTTPLQKKLP
ncbi:MAG TPA: hypothetical protein VIJ95_01085 [Hanamia sp.]